METILKEINVIDNELEATNKKYKNLCDKASLVRKYATGPFSSSEVADAQKNLEKLEDLQNLVVALDHDTDSINFMIMMAENKLSMAKGKELDAKRNGFRSISAHYSVMEAEGKASNTLEVINRLQTEKDNLIAKLQIMKNNSMKSKNPLAYLSEIAPDTEIEYRRNKANNMTKITENEARLDLFYNKETPFIFRKYLRNIADSLPESAGPAEIHCGIALNKILGCNCGGAMHTDPTKDWNYAGRPYYGLMDGQYSIKSRKGPCSHWSGHTGYCWEGTAAHPSGNPANKIIGEWIDDWHKVKDAILRHTH